MDALLQSVPAGIAFFRGDSNGFELLTANRLFVDLMGKEGDELARDLSGDLAGVIHSEDVDRVRLMLYRAVVTGGVFRETARLVDESLDGHWVELWLNSVPQGDGTYVVCLMVNDVNAQRDRQRKLDTAYDHLLGVLNNVPGGIVVYDAVGGMNPVPSFGSQGMDRLLCGTHAQIREAIADDPFALVHPDDREEITRTVESALRNLSAFQTSFRVRTIPGDYIWVSASGTVESSEGDRILYIALVDVSADKEQQRMQEQVLDSFMRQQYEHVVTVDFGSGSFRTLGVGKGAIENLPMAGDDFQQVLDKVIDAFVSVEDRDRIHAATMPDAIAAQLKSRDDVVWQYCVNLPSGKVRYKKTWASWIDKEAKTLAFITSDVTEEHRQDEESRETLRSALRAAEQANEAKSEFLSRMSHDIRTPLNAIVGYTTMGLEDPGVNADERARLLKTASSSQFLLTLVNDVLDMSRIESGKLVLHEEAFDIADLTGAISSIVGAQCGDQGIEFIWDVAYGVHQSYVGDRLKLQQVLLNIIGNSIKFTPPGGSITFSVREQFVEGHRTIVRFVIADTGGGISKDFLPHVFDTFSQEHSDVSVSKGSGLGLAICKSLVTMMGGTITAESEEGVSTTFTVDVPLVSVEQEYQLGEPRTVAEDHERRLEELKGRCVLLAEDNAMNMEIAKYLLEGLGLEVDTVENGRVALDEFTASEVGHYDAFLTDIRMPVMDGLEASRAIRQLDRADAKDMPIIAMSANAFDEDVRNSKAYGVTAYVVKPIDPKVLEMTLAENLS